MNNPHLRSDMTNRIQNVYQLQLMREDLAADYELVSHVDASDTVNWDWNGSSFDGFNPIGDETTKFTGSLDGNDYVISDIYMNRAGTSNNLLNNIGLKPTKLR